MQYQPWFKAFADLPERKAHYSDVQFRAFVEVLCAAAASRTPGCFTSLAAVRRIVGGAVDFLVEQGDLVVEEDGSVTIHRWKVYQRPFDEGHAERQRRYRDSKNDVADDASSGSSHERHNGSSTSTSISKTFSEGDSFPAPAPVHAPARGEVVGYPDGDRDALDTYHELSGYRPWGVWSGESLRAAVVDYGDAVVDAALRFEAGRDSKRDTLLKRALAKLARDAERAEQDRVKAPKVVRPKMDEAAYQAGRQKAHDEAVAMNPELYAKAIKNFPSKHRTENAG